MEDTKDKSRVFRRKLKVGHTLKVKAGKHLRWEYLWIKGEHDMKLGEL